MLVARLPEQSTSVEEMQLLVQRLNAVSKGSYLFSSHTIVLSTGTEAREMILPRSQSGNLDYHVHNEGVVTDVEMYSKCWQAGLRQGSRLVEVSFVVGEPDLRDFVLVLAKQKTKLFVLTGKNAIEKKKKKRFVLLLFKSKTQNRAGQRRTLRERKAHLWIDEMRIPNCILCKAARS